MLALGVDPGEDAVSLALVEVAGRAPRLVGSWREPRDPSMGLSEQLRACVATHCKSSPDAVATALPGRQATFRLLRLPFADQARLAATVPFELESLVPFELSTAITSFAPLDRSNGGTTVLAAIAPREAVRAHLHDLRTAGLDPAIVDIGAVATAGLFERALDLLVVEAREDGAVALLQDDHLAALHALDAGDRGGDDEMRRRIRWGLLAIAGEKRPEVAAARLHESADRIALAGTANRVEFFSGGRQPLRRKRGVEGQRYHPGILDGSARHVEYGEAYRQPRRWLR